MIRDQLPSASFRLPVAPWLAQSPSLVPFLAWLGVAIAILAVAGVVLLLYRRKVLAKDAGRDEQAGLMDNLRAMRDRGELSPDEYDAAKRAMVARFSGPTSGASPRPVRKPAAGDARVAPPGVDLTGAPLPRPPSDAGRA